MRVVVADDVMLTREGITRLLTDAGVDVVGQAGDAASLLRAVRMTQPDAAVVDIRMPPTHTDEGLVTAQQGSRRRTRQPGGNAASGTKIHRDPYAAVRVRIGPDLPGTRGRETIRPVAPLTRIRSELALCWFASHTAFRMAAATTGKPRQTPSTRRCTLPVS